ncbi:MAG: T6SS phospholipase effector Tle1-like catalytic domain-containing protein, partial [Telluria sp.]
YTHFFKVYVPGVASPFPQVNDSGEGMQGKAGAAAGAFGERRIIWALVQAINNVHRYFLKTPLILQPELDGMLRRIVLNKYSRSLMVDGGWFSAPVPGKEVNLKARREFEAILLRLHSAISRHVPDPKTGKVQKIDPAVVKKIYVSVFGFSRGATQARAFINWLQSLCKLDAQLRGKPDGMSLGGFDVEFDFLGIFDTVASVGAGNTLGNGVGRLFDGHGAWADSEDSLRIPPGVNCLHLVAAHELRRSFPVDSISINGALHEGCEEIVVPGVHSDVGCGYCPGEQGRGTDSNGDDMLARIPLLMMYRAARLKGVPLKLEVASPVAKDRFALKSETIAAFNAYIATCKETHGPLHRIMREQARKQMEWRLVRRVTSKSPLQASPSFLRASAFDQNDLYSAGCEFEDEIAEFGVWLKEKGRDFRPASQEGGFDNEHLAEWEEIATWWGKAPQPGVEVLRFFDDYVHDSRAWFKLIPGNPDNEKDLHALLASWVKKRKAVKAHNDAESKRFGNGQGGAAPRSVGAFDYKHVPVSDGLTEGQRRAADEYARTGRIPRMTTAGREPFSASWESLGLSSRAGYLRFRKIYGGSDSVLISSAPAHGTVDVRLASLDLPDRGRSASA